MGYYGCRKEVGDALIILDAFLSFQMNPPTHRITMLHFLIGYVPKGSTNIAPHE